MAPKNSLQGKHREFVKITKRQGKRREKNGQPEKEMAKEKGQEKGSIVEYCNEYDRVVLPMIRLFGIERTEHVYINHFFPRWCPPIKVPNIVYFKPDLW